MVKLHKSDHKIDILYGILKVFIHLMHLHNKYLIPVKLQVYIIKITINIT